jgi:hypothetical protein
MTGRTSAVANYPRRGRVAATTSIEEEHKAKAYALKCFAWLVEEGRAQWHNDVDGAELHLVTGDLSPRREHVVANRLMRNSHGTCGNANCCLPATWATGANSKIRNG